MISKNNKKFIEKNFMYFMYFIYFYLIVKIILRYTIKKTFLYELYFKFIHIHIQIPLYELKRDFYRK